MAGWYICSESCGSPGANLMTVPHDTSPASFIQGAYRTRDRQRFPSRSRIPRVFPLRCLEVLDPAIGYRAFQFLHVLPSPVSETLAFPRKSPKPEDPDRHVSTCSRPYRRWRGGWGWDGPFPCLGVPFKHFNRGNHPSKRRPIPSASTEVDFLHLQTPPPSFSWKLPSSNRVEGQLWGKVERR